MGSRGLLRPLGSAIRAYRAIGPREIPAPGHRHEGVCRCGDDLGNGSRAEMAGVSIGVSLPMKVRKEARFSRSVDANRGVRRVYSKSDAPDRTHQNRSSLVLQRPRRDQAVNLGVMTETFAAVHQDRVRGSDGGESRRETSPYGKPIGQTPTGDHRAFTAGLQTNEVWAMENFLPKPLTPPTPRKR